MARTTHRPAPARDPGRAAVWALWWLIAAAVAIASYPFTNDHFGRISAARQIARYGELPFRDFLDPGYVLTELASAGVQRLLGDTLLGEMLLTSAFIATGAVLVIALIRRFALSRVAAAAIGIVVVMLGPRPYDYDKFLFYPLGILLCWRYVDSPGTGRVWMLAAGAVIAGMFRYDNGVFILAAGVVTIVSLHARALPLLRRRVGVLLLASAVCAVPYLLFLQVNGGLITAADQMVAYARREGARTRLSALPALVPSELRLLRLPDRVQVRWAPASDERRAALERRYALHSGARQSTPDARTWLYEIDDASRDNLRALIDDPHVADTHLVDRGAARLVHEGPWLARLHRALPVVGRWRPSWTPEGAADSLFWLWWILPIAAVATALRRGSADAAERARVLGTATLAVLVAVFILREPLVARVSGAAAPALVLGAWLWGRVRRNWVSRAAAVAVMLTIVAATDWYETALRLERNLPSMGGLLRAATTTPPSDTFLPSTPVRPVVEYVRRCTRPDDRVFAAWFVPELYFFSQRAFAGGMPFTFGHHWSEEDYQRRIVVRLASESVPIAILPHPHVDFSETYHLVDAYFRSHYQSAGVTTFGRAEGDTYEVLTNRERAPTGTDPASTLPCFAATESTKS